MGARGSSSWMRRYQEEEGGSKLETVNRRASRGRGCCVKSIEEQIYLIGPSHTTISSTASWSETGDGPHATPDLPHVIL